MYTECRSVLRARLFTEVYTVCSRRVSVYRVSQCCCEQDFLLKYIQCVPGGPVYTECRTVVASKTFY